MFIMVKILGNTAYVNRIGGQVVSGRIIDLLKKYWGTGQIYSLKEVIDARLVALGSDPIWDEDIVTSTNIAYEGNWIIATNEEIPFDFSKLEIELMKKVETEELNRESDTWVLNHIPLSRQKFNGLKMKLGNLDRFGENTTAIWDSKTMGPIDFRNDDRGDLNPFFLNSLVVTLFGNKDKIFEYYSRCEKISGKKGVIKIDINRPQNMDNSPYFSFASLDFQDYRSDISGAPIAQYGKIVSLLDEAKMVVRK